jgi:hypothetical protein
MIDKQRNIVATKILFYLLKIDRFLPQIASKLQSLIQIERAIIEHILEQIRMDACCR